MRGHETLALIRVREDTLLYWADEINSTQGAAPAERVSVMNPGNTLIPPTPDDSALLAQSCR